MLVKSTVKKRRWTQKEYVGETEEEESRNPMYEDNDVSSRHTTWWKTSWWIRIEDGSSLGAESGKQPGERLKKPAMETGVGEAQRQAEEAKGERNRPDRAARTRCTLSCICLQTQRQQQL